MKKIEDIYRENLILLIEEHGSIQNLANLLGKSHSQISQWKNASKDSKTGKPRSISNDQARMINAACNKPPGWMETDHSDFSNGFKASETINRNGPAELVEIGEDPEYITIRRVEFKLTGGITGFKVEYLNGERQPIVFRKDWFESRGYDASKLYAISVKGHSMSPKINEDDVVVINTADNTPVDTKLFAINYEGELLVKRLVRDAGQWYLSSDNPDKVQYPNKICHGDCFIIGRVVYLQTENL